MNVKCSHHLLIASSRQFINTCQPSSSKGIQRISSTHFRIQTPNSISFQVKPGKYFSASVHFQLYYKNFCFLCNLYQHWDYFCSRNGSSLILSSNSDRNRLSLITFYWLPRLAEECIVCSWHTNLMTGLVLLIYCWMMAHQAHALPEVIRWALKCATCVCPV